MIIRTDLLQESCAKILNAVDSNVLASVTETLEITGKDNQVVFAVTNREYYVEIKLDTDVTEDFHATVNANLFLKLVSKVTSETIELTIQGNSLKVKCNGEYKLPLIFEGDKLMTLPKIEIENVSEKLEMDSSVLHSIANFNSKELGKGTISKPIQKLHYVDNKGAVTFTTGACVNNFTSNMKSKLLFNDRLVKLFKLFKDKQVEVTVGHNVIDSDTNATVVVFDAPGIHISSILSCDDTMLSQYPVSAIRGRSETSYPSTVSLNKTSLLQTIDRLTLFAAINVSDVNRNVMKLEFKKDGVTIYDRSGANKETVYYSNPVDDMEEYTVSLESSDLTKTLATCVNQLVTVSFGNRQAVLVTEGMVHWVIPECIED